MANEKLGRLGSVKIAGNTVLSLNGWKISIDGSEIDITTFGDEMKRKLMGVREWSATASGICVIGEDTNGQKELWDHMIAGTALGVVKFYLDSTHYIASDTTDTDAAIYVKKMSVDCSNTDVVKVDIEFTCSGLVAQY